MPKTRAQKQGIVAQLSALLRQAKSGVFCNYYGLTVADLQELRSTLRKQGAQMLVTSKTLFSRAAKDTNLAVDPKQFEGGLGIAFGLTDEVAPAKVLYTFGKTHEALKIQGGFMGTEVVDASYVTALAQLPSRDELIARAVGSIAAPIGGFVRVLSGTLRSVVYTLKAIEGKKTA